MSLFSALDPARIDLGQLDTLMGQLTSFQLAITSLNSFAVSGQIFSAPSQPSILEKFRGRLAVALIPADLLALQITCLILFFVSVMAGMLVDRQAEAIAVLRSRDASGLQVLGSLATQSLGVCLVAVIIGPPLALLLVYLLTTHSLSPSAQSALDVVTRNPVQALSSVIPYALLTKQLQGFPLNGRFRFVLLLLAPALTRPIIVMHISPHYTQDESPSLRGKDLIEPIEHHPMLQTEIVELPVAGPIFGNEDVLTCSPVRDGRNGFAGLLKQFWIIA